MIFSSRGRKEPSSPLHPLAGAMSPGRPEQTPGPRQSPLHPLALAMEKKTKKPKKGPETYAEEGKTSQSQQSRSQSLAEHERRRRDMEKHLVAAEEQLIEMTELLDKREKLLKEAEEDSSQTSSADPESEKDSEKKEDLGKKFTKKRIQQMREKLQQMDSQTEYFLSDIENTMLYLGSLSDASDRVGPLSEETQALIDRDGTDDFIAKVSAENVPAKRQSSCSQRGTRKSEEEDSSPEQSEDSYSDDDEEGRVSRSKGSKVFLTAREDSKAGGQTSSPGHSDGKRNEDND